MSAMPSVAIARGRARELLCAIRGTHSFSRIHCSYAQVVQFIEESHECVYHYHHAAAQPRSALCTVEDAACNARTCSSPSSVQEHMLFCSLLVGCFCRCVERVWRRQQQQQRDCAEEAGSPTEGFFGAEGTCAHGGTGAGSEESAHNETVATEREHVRQVCRWLQTLRALLLQFDYSAENDAYTSDSGEMGMAVMAGPNAHMKSSNSSDRNSSVAAASLAASPSSHVLHPDRHMCSPDESRRLSCPAILYGLDQMEDCAHVLQLHLQRKLQNQMACSYWNVNAMAHTICGLNELNQGFSSSSSSCFSFIHARHEEPAMCSDGSLEATLTATPLRDPLTQRVIAIPARGRSCTHPEVFDLVGFIRSVYHRRTTHVCSTGTSASRISHPDDYPSQGCSSHHGHRNQTKPSHDTRKSYSNNSDRSALRHRASSVSHSSVASNDATAAVGVGGRCPWCQTFIPLHTVCVDQQAVAAMESYRNGHVTAEGPAAAAAAASCDKTKDKHTDTSSARAVKSSASQAAAVASSSTVVQSEADVDRDKFAEPGLILAPEEQDLPERRAVGKRKLTTQHALQWDFVSRTVRVVESERVRRGAGSLGEVTCADSTTSSLPSSFTGSRLTGDSPSYTHEDGGGGAMSAPSKRRRIQIGDRVVYVDQEL